MNPNTIKFIFGAALAIASQLLPARGTRPNRTEEPAISALPDSMAFHSPPRWLFR